MLAKSSQQVYLTAAAISEEVGQRNSPKRNDAHGMTTPTIYGLEMMRATGRRTPSLRAMCSWTLCALLRKNASSTGRDLATQRRGGTFTGYH